MTARARLTKLLKALCLLQYVSNTESPIQSHARVIKGRERLQTKSCQQGGHVMLVGHAKPAGRVVAIHPALPHKSGVDLIVSRHQSCMPPVGPKHPRFIPV